MGTPPAGPDPQHPQHPQRAQDPQDPGGPQAPGGPSSSLPHYPASGQAGAPWPGDGTRRGSRSADPDWDDWPDGPGGPGGEVAGPGTGRPGAGGRAGGRAGGGGGGGGGTGGGGSGGDCEAGGYDYGWGLPGAQEDRPGEPMPQLDIAVQPPQHRGFVFFRLPLLLPHAIVLAFLSVAAFFAVVLGWFAALLLGRLPGPLAAYLTGYLGYLTRFHASAMLLVGRYPPFTLSRHPDYPVRVEVPRTRLNRLAVFFRILLAVPALVVEGLLVTGWWAAAVIIWLVTLVFGGPPEPLFEASAAVLRYAVRTAAYLLLLTSAYPKGLLGDGPAEQAGRSRYGSSATRPLLVGMTGRLLVGLFGLLGLVGAVTGGSTGPGHGNDMDSPAHTSSIHPT